MKPSERIFHTFVDGGSHLDAQVLATVLDEFDARLAKLEAAAPPVEELDPTKPLYVGDGRPALGNEVGGFPPHVMCARCSGPIDPLKSWQNKQGVRFCGAECFRASEAAAYEPEPDEEPQ